MGAVPLLAQANSTQTSSQITKPVTPYGENPNLLHVFAYKAQEGVINTAEKVGKVTEKASPELNQMSTAPGTTPNLLPQILFKRWIREHSRQLNKLTRESELPRSMGWHTATTGAYYSATSKPIIDSYPNYSALTTPFRRYQLCNHRTLNLRGIK